MERTFRGHQEWAKAEHVERYRSQEEEECIEMEVETREVVSETHTL